MEAQQHYLEITHNDQLRQQFRTMNRFMLLLWRLGFGRWMSLWPSVFGAYLVITHTGRKTGRKRRTPVNFYERGGYLYCLAGFGPTSDWYRNVMTDPNIEVWLPDGWWQATAEDVTDTLPDSFSVVRKVMINSGFAARSFGLNPTAPEDELRPILEGTYRLLRIRRTDPCTGHGGPADLAWVWPLATFGLLLWSFRPHRK